ncbi:MAG: hypothetical protein HOD63_09065 [Bacteroidetes bacterium]|jgi:hypothetical protein|nr:hypothetical protein [Bacteroidota bacterium]MBT5530324.1 hypothetical protein [Cytophagia bacterium]MBT4338727.1 hypothetical protein [Bacteroidota bacterium]MBT5989951.1 hypothetical protein [Bacteroidota bacterium]MBT6837400.1 hypothetical protein [Bacteroidota bacterium]
MKKVVALGLIMLWSVLISFSQSNSKPKIVYKIGSVRVSVWDNPKEGKYGSYTEKNFKVERIYKSDDKWESTNYYNADELLQLKAVIDLAIGEELVVTNSE